MHIVLRVSKEVPRLRQSHLYRAIRLVLQRYLGQEDFRVVHLSIQHNHLHLLVEAASKQVLTRRMQSFAINAARAINAANRQTGKVFAHRYHATQILTPRQARCTLAYVLNNWRHHKEDLKDMVAFEAHLDPYSSAVSFTGWKKRFRVPDKYQPLPVSPPTTTLLSSSWLRYGRLDPFECPGGPRF